MLFYVSILNALDVKFKFLMSQVELTQFLVESSCIKLKIWAIWLESSWKYEQLDSISIWIQNVNLKLNSTISLLSEVWQKTFNRLSSKKMLNHWWVQFYDCKSDERVVYLIKLNQKHLETHDILMTASL